MVESKARTSVPQILEKHLAAMNDEFDSLTKKAQQTITVSTVIIGFATTFATFNLTQNQLSLIEKGTIIASFLVYVAIFGLSLLASIPQGWTAYPINTDEDSINRVVQMDDDTFYKELVGAFMTCLADNDKTLKRMTQHIRIASALIVIEVFLVMLTKII